MFHELLRVWFGWVSTWGYLGVFVLMALESSVVPVPSEIVMAPAAFWAAQGRMNLALVVLAGALGSYAGSVASYLVSQWVGLPIVQRYGKYFLLPAPKLEAAEEWIQDYGAMGVFTARFLPVVRHLVSIPAGILRMPFGRFSLSTFLGAGLWCAILSWFGQETIGKHPDLLDSPEALHAALKDKLEWFVAAVVIFAGLYAVTVWMRSRTRAATLR